MAARLGPEKTRRDIIQQSSVKHEDIYLRDYEDGLELEDGLFKWFAHYNEGRPHQALGYATPRGA